MDMDHVNWEMWKSPSFCEDEDHAETLLEYYDSGIFGTGFLTCLKDAIERKCTITTGMQYALHKDLEYA
jgi:hypothetical protein